jgi:hypothetical protein
MHISDRLQELQHSARRHLALRGPAAVAAAVLLTALASACARHVPSPHAATPAHPATAAAASAIPSGPAPASGAAPAHGTAPAGPAPGTGVPRCNGSQLTAGTSAYQTQSLSGTGQRGITITLTNTGSTSCSLYGYPGLGLEDAAHHVLPSHTRWGPTYFAHDPGPRLIVLSPGQGASASVALSAGGQHALPAAYLQVTPPNAYRHAVIMLVYGTGDTSGDLHVTAMALHTTTYRGYPWSCGCQH